MEAGGSTSCSTGQSWTPELIASFKVLKRCSSGQIDVGFFFLLSYKSYVMIHLLVSSWFISSNHFHTEIRPSNTTAAFKGFFLSAVTDILFSFEVCRSLLKCDFSDLIEAAYFDKNLQ